MYSSVYSPNHVASHFIDACHNNVQFVICERTCLCMSVCVRAHVTVIGRSRGVSNTVKQVSDSLTTYQTVPPPGKRWPMLLLF